jgi:hypothetical protein
MASAHKTIHITDDTALADLLDDAAREPIILERGGDRFRLSLVDDLFADYDPERVRDGLRRFAGTITLEEADHLRQILYGGREEGTRPIDRP